MDAGELLRQHTTPRPVPLVPEIRVHTANEITPVWRDVDAVPYWCVPWAGGQALARWVLDHPEAVKDQRVIDFGSGSGLVAIAAARAGAAHVIAVDVDPFAKTAIDANAALNGVALETLTRDLVGDANIDADVLLAGDVWYEREPAARFDAWFRTLAARARVLTGDPGRSYVPADLVELARYEVPTTLDLEGALAKTARVLALPGAVVPARGSRFDGKRSRASAWNRATAHRGFSRQPRNPPDRSTLNGRAESCVRCSTVARKPAEFLPPIFSVEERIEGVWEAIPPRAITTARSRRYASSVHRRSRFARR